MVLEYSSVKLHKGYTILRYDEQLFFFGCRRNWLFFASSAEEDYMSATINSVSKYQCLIIHVPVVPVSLIFTVSFDLRIALVCPIVGPGSVADECITL